MTFENIYMEKQNGLKKANLISLKLMEAIDQITMDLVES